MPNEPLYQFYETLPQSPYNTIKESKQSDKDSDNDSVTKDDFTTTTSQTPACLTRFSSGLFIDDLRINVVSFVGLIWVNFEPRSGEFNFDKRCNKQQDRADTLLHKFNLYPCYIIYLSQFIIVIGSFVSL